MQKVAESIAGIDKQAWNLQTVLVEAVVAALDGVLELPEEERQKLEKQAPKPRQCRPTLSSLLAQTEHHVRRLSSKRRTEWDCWNCMTRPRHRGLRAWLTMPCSKTRLNARTQWVGKAPHGADMARELGVHDSHKLDFYRGLLWCKRCGCRTSGKKTLRLKQPCHPSGCPQLQVHLARLARRQLPSNLGSWPDGKPAQLPKGAAWPLSH